MTHSILELTRNYPALLGGSAARTGLILGCGRVLHDQGERNPDPTPHDIAAAEAAEAALPSRKRMEVQLRRSFTPLAAHLPSEVKRSRKRFVQRHQRAWNRANLSPLTQELERTLTAEYMKTYGQ